MTQILPPPSALRLVVALVVLILFAACSDREYDSPTASSAEALESIDLLEEQMREDSLWIVVLERDVVSDVTERSTSMVSTGGRVVSASQGLEAFVAALGPSTAKRLQQHPAVAAVGPYPQVSFGGHSVQEDAAFGLDRLDERTLLLDGEYHYTHSGTGVNLYIMDSGVNEEGDLVGRGITGHGFAGADEDDCFPGNGHGTPVASAAGGSEYGVARDANLFNLALGCMASSALFDALDWIEAEAQAPAVLNMSIGTCMHLTDLEDPNGGGPGGGTCPPASPELDSLVHRVADAGVLVVMAAGNVARNACESSPGRIRQWRSDVLVVAASTSTDARWADSSFGSDCVDLFAPGEDITATTKQGGTAEFSGTSLAAPYVAGAAAVIFEESPGYSSLQVANEVRSRATAGIISDSQGSPNRLLYVLSPLHVTMTPAPSSLPADTVVTWTAHPVGGSEHYEYQWASRFVWADGFTEDWVDLGTGTDQETQVPAQAGQFEIRVTVESLDVQEPRIVSVPVDCSSVICATSVPGGP